MSNEPTPSSKNDVKKSYVLQKFAKLTFGQYTAIGYSVAGEESVCQIAELNVCFDIGRCPQFCLTSDIICMTHGHMDHLAGIAYYLSQRMFQGMKPGTILLPAELERPVEKLLAAWRDIERQDTPYELIPMTANQLHTVRRDFGIRAVQTHHGGPSLGYALISIREKLKAEYMHIPGDQLAQMKRDGTEIQYRVEVPMITYLGDTTAGTVFEQPDVINAELLITECTFYDTDHKKRAKVGRHLHVEDFAKILPRLNNKHILLTHVSRRTGSARAKRILEKLAYEGLMHNVHFLMDFTGSEDAGEIEPVGDNPA